jgi:hypothetical protein
MVWGILLYRFGNRLGPPSVASIVCKFSIKNRGAWSTFSLLPEPA